MYSYVWFLVKTYRFIFDQAIMAQKPINEQLRAIRESKGWSRERLSHEAYKVDRDGTSYAQITAIERGNRRASAATILALAEALEVDPEIFPEYRLALARHLLDEAKVGLTQAVKNLERSRLEPTGLKPADIRRHSHAGKLKKAKRAVGRTGKK